MEPLEASAPTSAAEVLAPGAALLGATLAGAAAARRSRRARRGGQAPARGGVTQRRLFGDSLEQLNPFYEAPTEKTRKELQPIVDKINSMQESFKAKSDEELRDFTYGLKEKAQSGTSLDDLLPEAFAVVREASARVLGLRHFDVQLMGGIALHRGQIAEMGTGEGKTLVAILPAFLNALRGKGCHVVTVNDYLARRDAEWVGQPLRFLDVSVGIVQGGMVPEQRRKAYRCDVTYVTNSELGFDYLRDQMAPAPSDLCLRERDPFQFAIVDEVDSILIDEARTPLIISGVASSQPQKYDVAKEVARALKKVVHYEVDEKQRQCVLLEGGIEAAEQLLNKNDLFDPEDPWFPFLMNALNAKELYLKDKQYIVKKGEIMIVDEFTGRVMDGRRWSNGLHQAVEAKEGVKIQSESVTLASISYQSLFRLFKKLGGMTGTAFTEAKEFEEIYKLKTIVVPPNQVRKREDSDDQVYVDDIGKWKAVARDIENAHRIGRPVLVGTTNVQNSEIVAELLEALNVPYRLLNAKPENVARETEVIANSGRKYMVTIATNMAGRGTDILLGGNASIMARLQLREALYTKLFPKTASKWTMPDDFYPIDLSAGSQAKVQEAVDAALAAWAPEASLKANSLEAAEKIIATDLTELDAEERLSVACEKVPTEDPVILKLREAFQAVSGEFKEITDLEKAEVIALGGLYVMGTERHESRRIDNQLRGRSARQGDPGKTRFYLSLNDTIFRIFGGDSIKNMMNMMSFSEPDDVPLESGLLSNSLEEAQKKVENYFYSVRKNVFEYDDVMDTQRQIVYGLRRRALLDTDESIRETLLEFCERNMEDFADGHTNTEKPISEWNLDKLAENVGIFCGLMKDTVTPEMLKKAAGGGGTSGKQAVSDLLMTEVQKALDAKCQQIEESGPGLTAMISRQILLMQLDQYWQQHLKNMDFMKTGVTLRAYGQKNPLTEYKLEGYQVFLKMMSRIRRNAIYNLFLFTPRKLTPMTKDRIQALIPNRETRRRQMAQMIASEDNINREARKIQESAMAEAVGSSSQTVNLARLALNVRQLLEARAEMKELALAGFSELKDSFGRAGLLTLGDQLRWASACKDFELLEDTMSEEVYIGLVGRTTPEERGDETPAQDAQSREVFQQALEDPEFLKTVDQFANAPDAFLTLIKQQIDEGSWDGEDAQKMRELYNASGLDIDETLRQMSEAMDDLPPEQREVVEFMQKLLNDPGSVTPKKGDGVDKKEEKSEVNA